MIQFGSCILGGNTIEVMLIFLSASYRGHVMTVPLLGLLTLITWFKVTSASFHTKTLLLPWWLISILWEMHWNILKEVQPWKACDWLCLPLCFQSRTAAGQWTEATSPACSGCTRTGTAVTQPTPTCRSDGACCSASGTLLPSGPAGRPSWQHRAWRSSSAPHRQAAWGFTLQLDDSWRLSFRNHPRQSWEHLNLFLVAC